MQHLINWVCAILITMIFIVITSIDDRMQDDVLQAQLLDELVTNEKFSQTEAKDEQVRTVGFRAMGSE